MHLKLDDERAALQDTVRAFAREQVRPKAREWEEEQRIGARTLDEAWQLGFASMGVGPSFGGAGENDDVAPSALSNAIVLEELAHADLGFALAAFSPMHAVVPLALFGEEGLKHEQLPKLVGGATLPKATGAWIEPSRNYDTRTHTLRAEKSAQGPVLSGRKMLVPRGDDSELTVVVARARTGEDTSALEPFVLLGKNVSGLTRGKRADVIGPRATPLVELVLDDASARPLSTHNGVVHRVLEERALIGSAAAALGVARAATDLAVEYARDRKAFGRAIAQNQAIAFMLAESAMDVEAARWLVWKAAWSVDKHRAASPLAPEASIVEASRAFRHTTDLAFRVADICVQIFGGHGVIRDHLAELLFRNSRTLARTPGWFIV